MVLPYPAMAEPPQAPTVAFTGVYDVEMKSPGSSQGGRVQYWVDRHRMRSEPLDAVHAGYVTIFDLQAKTLTEFDKRDPKKVATRYERIATNQPIAQGYAEVAAATPGIPLPAGADTVAGKPCDKLRFEGGATGEAELCVTAEGVILAYRQKTEDGTEVSAVAIKMDYGRQDPRLFQVPKGFRVTRKR